MLFSIGKVIPSISLVSCCANMDTESSADFTLKVNLSDFPDLGKLDLRRSMSLSGVDASGMVVKRR